MMMMPPMNGQAEDGKIFVGGLAPHTSQDSLREYFQQFGEVIDCVLMVDNITRNSRGFGFVTFRDPAAIQGVVDHSLHILDGKQIDPKKAVPKGPGQEQILKRMGMGGMGGGGVGGGYKKNFLQRNPELKIFVGGISQKTTEDDLRQYFSEFGRVTDIAMPKDRESGNYRGFAFVGFDSPEPVARTRSIHFHQIQGKTVEVKGCTEQRPDPTERMGMSMGMGMGAASNGQYAMGMQGITSDLGYGSAIGRGYGASTAAAAAAAGYSGYGAMAQHAAYSQPPGATASPYASYGIPSGNPASAYADLTTSAYGQTAGVASAYGAYGALSAGAGAGAATAGTTGAGYGGMTSGLSSSLTGATATSTDYTSAYGSSMYGFGNYAQEASSYGPSRTTDLTGYGQYSTTAVTAATAAYATDPTLAYGASAAYGDAAGFGRGASAARGFHPYGR